MENIFEKKGIDLDQMVAIIANQEAIVKFLEDIKTDYRIQRAMGPDENDHLLNGTYVIDDILTRLSKLEPARKEYFARLAEEEANKKKEEENT